MECLDAYDYILTHPKEFLDPIRQGNDKENNWDLLLLSRATFMKGWKPTNKEHVSLFDELFNHYFEYPVEVQKIFEASEKPLIWLPPVWFGSLRSLPSSSRGQVYLSQCRVPWKHSSVRVAIRAVDDITKQCFKNVIGVTAVRSKYRKHHMLGLVSLAADITLEQWIPQADQWSFQRIYRVALMTASAVRDLHNVNMFHSNLQPRNILITGERLELVDQVTLVKSRLYGRYPYFAPELQVNQKSNIFALGIILWQLASGVIFPYSTNVCSYIYRIGPLKHFDTSYQDLFTRCLSKRPERRPTAEQVCNSLIQIMLQNKSIIPKQEHSLQVRQKQILITKYLLQSRQEVSLPAIKELMHGATLKKRMMIRAIVSLEAYYESKKDSNDDPIQCGW